MKKSACCHCCCCCCCREKELIAYMDKYVRWLTRQYRTRYSTNTHAHTYAYEHTLQTSHITCTDGGVNKDADMNANTKPCITPLYAHNDKFLWDLELIGCYAGPVKPFMRQTEWERCNQLLRTARVVISTLDFSSCLHFFYVCSWQCSFTNRKIIGLACIQSNLCSEFNAPWL